MLPRRKVYESNLEAQLALWRAEIDELQAKARHAEAGAKAQYDKRLEHLQLTHAEAAERLRSLQDAPDEAWESVKTGTEKAWMAFRTMFHASAEIH